MSIATGEAFPQAVHFLMPFFVLSNDFRIINEAGKSTHPDEHPKELLDLLEALLSTEVYVFQDDLRAILNRIENAAPRARDIPSFRKFNDFLRAQGH
jgi:hypothetical protein